MFICIHDYIKRGYSCAFLYAFQELICPSVCVLNMSIKQVNISLKQKLFPCGSVLVVCQQHNKGNNLWQCSYWIVFAWMSNANDTKNHVPKGCYWGDGSWTWAELASFEIDLVHFLINLGKTMLQTTLGKQTIFFLVWQNESWENIIRSFSQNLWDSFY